MKINENSDLNDLDGELWKSIDDYEDYFISNLGRVKSFKRYHGIDVRILEPWKNDDGYLVVCLYKNGEDKTNQIHRLMYENHIGEIPEGYVVHHIDFTKNNFLENFQMMTRKEHRILHNSGENNPNYGKHPSEKTKELMRESHIGKHPSEESRKLMRKKQKGESNPASILTEQDAIQIRIDLKEGILTQAEIGEKFGVKQQTISAIKLRKRWKHI